MTMYGTEALQQMLLLGWMMHENTLRLALALKLLSNRKSC